MELGRCVRCQTYVLIALVDGLRVSADTDPLDDEQYRAALVAGLTTYDVIPPGRLRVRSPALPGRPGPILAAHPCGTSAHRVRMTAVPHPDPVTSATAVPGSGPVVMKPVAPPAIPRRSEYRCGWCGGVITGAAWAIEHGRRTVWAAHDGPCP